MRKFETNVPHEVLPDVTRAVHGQNFVLTTKPTGEDDIVKIQVPYDADRNDDITELEEEINTIVEKFYDGEEESEEEQEEEEDEGENR
jgi:hypothetical protein